MAKVIIDAGHGGMDPGAIHEGRMEKNDTLNLALAVGDILKKNGVDVVYTLLRGRRMYTTVRLRRHRPQIGRAEIF